MDCAHFFIPAFPFIMPATFFVIPAKAGIYQGIRNRE